MTLLSDCPSCMYTNKARNNHKWHRTCPRRRSHPHSDSTSVPRSSNGHNHASWISPQGFGRRVPFGFLTAMKKDFEPFMGRVSLSLSLSLFLSPPPTHHCNPSDAAAPTHCALLACLPRRGGGVSGDRTDEGRRYPSARGMALMDFGSAHSHFRLILPAPPAGAWSCGPRWELPGLNGNRVLIQPGVWPGDKEANQLLFQDRYS